LAWGICRESLHKNQFLCKKPFAARGDCVIVPSNDAGKNKNNSEPAHGRIAQNKNATSDKGWATRLRTLRHQLPHLTQGGWT
jgi:hypothetical protein